MFVGGVGRLTGGGGSGFGDPPNVRIFENDENTDDSCDVPWVSCKGISCCWKVGIFSWVVVIGSSGTPEGGSKNKT